MVPTLGRTADMGHDLDQEACTDRLVLRRRAMLDPGQGRNRRLVR
jgi:hypothetical protein